MRSFELYFISAIGVLDIAFLVFERLCSVVLSCHIFIFRRAILLHLLLDA